MRELGIVLAGAAAGWLAAGREKPQPIRLADVLLLGPLMIYVATTPDQPPEAAFDALLAAGAATVTFNGRNYLRLRGRAEPTSYMGPG